MSVSKASGKYSQLKDLLHFNPKALLSGWSFLIYLWYTLTLALTIYFAMTALTSTRLNLRVNYQPQGLQVTGFDLSALKELQDSQLIQPNDLIIAFDKESIDQFLTGKYSNSKAIFYEGVDNSGVTLLTPGDAVLPPFKKDGFSPGFIPASVRARAHKRVRQ